ncbi:MAG: hypothetical protein GX256_08245 [Fretibacterium sp.]|nr:hypothetical protein [Fretibacterium sp.]
MSNTDNRPVDPVFFERFLENQKQELALKEKELDLEREKIRAGQKADERHLLYAQQQLEATERDRKDERLYKQTLEAKTLKLFTVFIFAATLFLIFAVWKDKEQMLVEIFKIVAYGGSFGFGGYAWGRYKRDGNEEK